MLRTLGWAVNPSTPSIVALQILHIAQEEKANCVLTAVSTDPIFVAKIMELNARSLMEQQMQVFSACEIARGSIVGALNLLARTGHLKCDDTNNEMSLWWAGCGMVPRTTGRQSEDPFEKNKGRIQACSQAMVAALEGASEHR
eukprot:FR742808.1.p1 GENE.FR742808.1~~FR742808.1.p1  ORF type:complete len:161 (+),score=12.69 FR742808.1:55-483(+)